MDVCFCGVGYLFCCLLGVFTSICVGFLFLWYYLCVFSLCKSAQSSSFCSLSLEFVFIFYLLFGVCFCSIWG